MDFNFCENARKKIKVLIQEEEKTHMSHLTTQQELFINEYVIILDESNYMTNVRDYVINNVIRIVLKIKNNQKKILQTHSHVISNISIKFFNSVYSTKLDRINVNNITEETIYKILNSYNPHNKIVDNILYDTLGNVLQHYSDLKNDIVFPYDNCKILVISSGNDNKSTKYNSSTIMEKIQTCREYYNIEVIVKGTNKHIIKKNNMKLEKNIHKKNEHLPYPLTRPYTTDDPNIVFGEQENLYSVYGYTTIVHRKCSDMLNNDIDDDYISKNDKELPKLEILNLETIDTNTSNISKPTLKRLSSLSYYNKTPTNITPLEEIVIKY